MSTNKVAPKWFDGSEAGYSAFRSYLKGMLNYYKADGPSDGKIVELIVTPKLVKEEWTKGFTHSSIPSTDSQFENYEFLGDKVLGFVFTEIMYNKYYTDFNEEVGTDLNNIYMSEDKQSAFTLKMKLMDYLYYDQRLTFGKKALGDIFEMFSGLLVTLGNKYVGDGVGTLLLKNVMVSLFAKEVIDLTALKQNPVSNLNMIINANKWNKVRYTEFSSDDPAKGDTACVILTDNGVVIAKGYGDSFRSSRRAAAVEAIKYLANAGLVTENLESVARLQHLKEEDEFVEAMNSYNERAKTNGNYPISRYRIEKKNEFSYTDKETKVSKRIFIQGLRVSYLQPDQVNVRWQELAIGEGPNVEVARVSAFTKATNILSKE